LVAKEKKNSGRYASKDWIRRPAQKGGGRQERRKAS